MQKPMTPTLPPASPRPAGDLVDGAAHVLGGLLDVQRHHQLAGLVGLGGRLAVVQVGGEGDEALGGEAVAHVLDVVDQPPPLLDHDDAGAAARTPGRPGSPGRSCRCSGTRRSHPWLREPTVWPMLDHLGIQCADVDASATFYDAVLAPLGAKRMMSFGHVHGYGSTKPDFWIGPLNDGANPSWEAHIAFEAPDRATVRALFEAAVAAGAEVLHEPGCGPSTTSTTTAPSCATPTATTSRPSATRAE